jgi:hypothetical protein
MRRKVSDGRSRRSSAPLASRSPSPHAFVVVLATGLAELAGCAAPAQEASPEALAGAYEVVNGTRRIECDGEARSAPFASPVWFFGETPLRRMDGLSSCEFRFGPRVTSEQAEAEILPGQVCQEWALDEDGAVTPRQILPLAWTVRRLESGLLWESYELLWVEGEGREARSCHLSAAATLAPAGAATVRAMPSPEGAR